MEHRYVQRKTVELKVWLSGVSFDNRPARVRNFCLDGMFIETFKDSLPVGSYVSVTLDYAGARHGCRCCLGALVVHSKGNGAGLMFNASRCERQRIFNEVLLDVVGPPGDDCVQYTNSDVTMDVCR